MWNRLLMVGIAVSTLASTLAFAQGKKGGGGANNNGPMTPQTVTRMDQFTQVLKLDREERKTVKSIMDDAQKEATPIKDQMDKERLAIAEAVAGGKQEDIDAAVKSYAGAETQMAGIEMNAFAKIYNALDKEQQQKSPQIYQLMPRIFKGKRWDQ